MMFLLSQREIDELRRVMMDGFVGRWYGPSDFRELFGHIDAQQKRIAELEADIEMYRAECPDILTAPAESEVK